MKLCCPLAFSRSFWDWGHLPSAWQGPTAKAFFIFSSFFIFSQLGIPSCLGGSRQNGFPSTDFMPTPLGHLVSLGNSCCCFGRGQKTKGHVLGRWLAGLTLVISMCLLSPIDCLCCSPQIVCSLHTAFYELSYCVVGWGTGCLKILCGDLDVGV